MMKMVLLIIGVIFFLGCVNSSNPGSGANCGNYDNNSTCVPADLNKEACNIDENVPICTSGNQWPDGGNIPSIPGIGTIPGITPPPSANQNGGQAGAVTDSACKDVAFGVGFAGIFAQSYGVELAYKGVASYKGNLWCSYEGSKPAKGETITVYQNPFEDDVWFVAQSPKGKAETHIANGQMVEVCDEEKCQPFSAPGN